MSRNELRIPTEAELLYAQQTMAVSAVDSGEVPGWEDRLKEYGPLLTSKLDVSRQEQNDCNADSGASGEEARKFYVTREMTQLARTYLYNACEYVSNPNYVGQDAGTSIPSAVIVLTEGIKSLGVPAGLPTEASYRYMTYERNHKRFAERAKGVSIEQNYVAQHGQVPPLEDLPLACALGATVHFGVFWGVKFETRTIAGNKYKVWTSISRGGGGHALEIVTCLWLDGQWYPAVWNSHGDGLILMPPEIYRKYQANQFSPFGGYLLMPDKPVERFHDRRMTGGGYYMPSNIA